MATNSATVAISERELQDAIGEGAYPGYEPLRPLEVHIWTPADWPDRIVEVLSGRPAGVTRGALWAG